MQYKFVSLSEATSVPTPKTLTPEEEKELLAQYKALTDSATVEQECRDALQIDPDQPTLGDLLVELSSEKQKNLKESA